MAQQPFKDWKTFAEQIDLLAQRGMVFHNKQQAEKELARIGYYRLSAYWYPFRQHLTTGGRADVFVANTQFDDVIALYDFDNAIKILALEAIQHIEIAMRTQIAYTLGKHNPIAHTQAHYFNPKFNHAEWLAKYENLRDHAKDDFVKHNLAKYGELPVWVACEIWDFGAMSKLYKMMTERDQRQIEKHFHLSHKELSSHLHALNIVRNVAAHHGRLWNKSAIGIPKIKKLHGLHWQYLNHEKPFVAFCLMKRMLDVIDPTRARDWGMRFQAALKTFPHQNCAPNEVNLQQFGIGIFPKTGELMNLSHWQLWK